MTTLRVGRSPCSLPLVSADDNHFRQNLWTNATAQQQIVTPEYNIKYMSSAAENRRVMENELQLKLTSLDDTCYVGEEHINTIQ